MIQSWKQALWLAKFEFTISKKNLLIAFLFFAFISGDIMLNFSKYLENRLIMIDIVFLAIFTAGPSLARPKHSQVQRINGGLLASPAFIMLSQLPIQQNILIKSRMIHCALFTFPFQVMLLILIYAVNPAVKSIMSPGQFAAFSIIWLSCSVYFGYAIPASDLGSNTTPGKNFIYGVLLIAIVFISVTFFNFFSSNSILYWTVVLAKKWPVLSSVISIVLAILGFNYWQNYMKRIANKINYL